MPLLVEKRGHVAILTLSRPEARNCWGDDYTEGLAEQLAAAEDDDDVRCVVLTGDEAGRAFSAGADLKKPGAHVTPSTQAFVKRVGRWRREPANLLSDFPKPLIAGVNGYAVGIGCIATFCCDMIVASDRAEWRLPQASLGLIPNHAGAPRAARFVGRGHAMRLAMGFPVKADEAYRIGLAQWLFPHEGFMEGLMGVAEHIAALPPLAARLAKESLIRGAEIPTVMDAALLDIYRFKVLEDSEDKVEAHAAWKEKRKPKFKGR